MPHCECHTLQLRSNGEKGSASFILMVIFFILTVNNYLYNMFTNAVYVFIKDKLMYSNRFGN